ncbi:restriction endonuclease subunit S [Alteromonas sp. ZYF713]|nr:restriction endonuclease subunit S [Alteromonas sp. ZYF713]
MTGRYQEYSEYKNSKLEWLGSIPQDWEIRYSKWLFSERNTKATKSDEMLTASQKYGVIPQKEFMRLEQQKVVQVQTGHEILKSVKKNDFVISMRSFQGGIEFCGYDGSVSSAYVPLIPSDEVNLGYFKYLFKSKQYIQALQSTTNLVRDGQALRYSNFVQVKLPLPEKTEQASIANFLDHETAKIDTLISKQKKLLGLLKEKRQAVISQAVTKGLNPDAEMKDSGVEHLGDVPKHWNTGQLKYLLTLNPKKSQVANKKEKLCNFIPMDKLKRDSLKLDEIVTVENVFDGYTYFENEDILMAKVTPCFENQNMVVARNLENGLGFGSSEIYVLRTKPHILNDYLYYRLQEDKFMQLATGAMTGAGGLKRVPSEFLLTFSIAFPDIEEQKRIIESIQVKLLTIDQLIDKALKAVSLMEERKTALISAAVTGKIDVRNFKEEVNE